MQKQRKYIDHLRNTRNERSFNIEFLQQERDSEFCDKNNLYIFDEDVLFFDLDTRNSIIVVNQTIYVNKAKIHISVNIMLFKDL